MSMERSFLNFEEGFGLCVWNAPSKEALEEMFKKAGTPFASMTAVEEHVAASLIGQD